MFCVGIVNVRVFKYYWCNFLEFEIGRLGCKFVGLFVKRCGRGLVLSGISGDYEVVYVQDGGVVIFGFFGSFFGFVSFVVSFEGG